MQRLHAPRWSVRGSVVLSALLLHSACGDRSVTLVGPPPEQAPEPNDGVGAPGRTAGDLTPPVGIAEGAGGAGERVAPLVGIAEEAGVGTAHPPPTDQLARAVGRFLETSCASCHGQVSAQGGLGDLSDLEGLIARGIIVPGASAQSPLVLRLLDGSMPPNAAIGSGEIALLGRFIDQLSIAPPPDCTALPFQGLDTIYAALLADVQRAPAPDRPFLRYVGLTYASNAGLCGPALERQRSALFKLVNSVSTASDIHAPQPIDSDGVLYRIDVRDYGWNRNIDLEGDGSTDFSDGWLAIVAGADTYGLELKGPDADALKQATGAAVPFLPANSLVHAASSGDLYYALVGMRALADDTEAELGIDREADLQNQLAQFAGLATSSPQSREAVVMRFEQKSFPGRYYWAAVEEPTSFDESIYEDPLNFSFGQWQAIVQLPNGMQAYEMIDPSGHRVDATERVCDNAYRPCAVPELRSVADCHACHEAGLLPVKDRVREFVEQNQNIFDRQTFTDVQALYPPEAEFNQLVLSDSQLYLGAVERAGVVHNGPEPISFVHAQFELDPLPLRRVAAELSVTPDALTAKLGNLDPRLGALQMPEAGVDRSTLSETYVASMCALHGSAANRPVACP